MIQDEDYRTAVFGKTERTVGWEGDGEPAMTGLLRHCTRGNPQRTGMPDLKSLSHPFTLDVALSFELEEDARRVMAVLAKRLGRYGLTLNPQKTRLVDFRAPWRLGGAPGERRPANRSFDMLGFTHFWARSRKGRWAVKRKTAAKRFGRAVKRITQWCRRVMHWKVADQQVHLNRKLRGHYAYYGITGNARALNRFVRVTERIWRKWLDRRSRSKCMPWPRFKTLLQRYPLLPPHIVHSYVA